MRIAPLGRSQDFEAILDIQRRVWGHGETDLTPTHQFRISVRMGAILLGGWVGGRLAGFVYSFPAVFAGRPVQHSHLLAVLPEYRGLGLGKRLKWAQRDRAIALGYDTITWTFDPLQARNANLNLHALGAVSRTYWPDFYGRQEALLLGPGVRTDRFLVEWPIRTRRMAARRAGRFALTIPRSAAWALARRNAAPAGPDGEAPLAPRPRGTSPVGSPARGGFPSATGVFGASLPSGPTGASMRVGNPEWNADPAVPGKPGLTLGGRVVLAEIPPAVSALKDRPELIAAWQKGLRRVLGHYFDSGYIADDFIFGERSFYVLRRLTAGQ